MNDTMVTVVGNVATAPVYREMPTGAQLRFRLAVTARRLSRETGAWIDGHTNFFTVWAWRSLGANAMSSLAVGDPVIVQGRLRVRADERDGQLRQSADIDAQAIGHDLSRGTAAFRRAPRAVDGPPRPPAGPDPWRTPGPVEGGTSDAAARGAVAWGAAAWGAKPPAGGAGEPQAREERSAPPAGLSWEPAAPSADWGASDWGASPAGRLTDRSAGEPDRSAGEPGRAASPWTAEPPAPDADPSSGAPAARVGAGTRRVGPEGGAPPAGGASRKPEPGHGGESARARAVPAVPPGGAPEPATEAGAPAMAEAAASAPRGRPRRKPRASSATG